MFQINWKLKSFLYSLFVFLRMQSTFYLVQKYITKRSRVNIAQINELWKFHANTIKKYKTRSLLEVGAGKSLEQNIFISYYFQNMISQTLIDINKMIDLNIVNHANEQILKLLGLKSKGDIKNLKDLKLKYNIDYSAPKTLDDLINNKKKFDICISTNTLEHFSKKDLGDYLYKIKKVISVNGLVSSVIDYSDHYSHTDKNISNLNFLQFSEKEWEKYNNPYLFQNRLRHQDYRKLFHENNFTIKDTFPGQVLVGPEKIDENFDKNNEETFISWAYYLIQN